jgi:hypothetical protein
MPAYLQQQLGQIAGDSAVSASTTSIANGAAHLMNALRIKFATAICAATALVGISSYAMVAKLAIKPIKSTAPLVTSQPIESEPKFAALYTPKPNQALIRIKPPFLPERLEYYRRHANINQVNAVPRGPDAIVFRWGKEGLILGSMRFGGAFDLNSLVQPLLGVFPQELEGDQNLVNGGNLKLPGDFVVRSGASQAQLMTGMEKILTDETGIPVTVTFRTVQRKVIVLSGRWNLKPIRSTPGELPMIEIYGRDLTNPRYGGGGGGGTEEFAKWLGRWINEQVVIEAPDQTLQWHLNAVYRQPADSAQAHQKDLVLQHIEEQTGLKSSEQLRMVKHLFIETQ